MGLCKKREKRLLFLPNLNPIKLNDDVYRIFGFIGQGAQPRSNKSGQKYFVTGFDIAPRIGWE